MGSQMDTTPSNIRIDRRTGQIRLDVPIMNYDFSSRDLEFAPTSFVPYRLTPGLVDFLGVSHIKGSLLSVLQAAYGQYVESQDIAGFSSFAGYLDFISATEFGLLQEKAPKSAKICTQVYLQQLKKGLQSSSLQQVLSLFIARSIDAKNRASMETTWCMWL